MKKLYVEIEELILTKTNDELKAIYDSSPDYKKLAIYNGIHYYYGEKITQWDYNLAYEILTRIMLEKHYIEQVEERSLTQDEETAYNNVLTIFHNQNTMLLTPPQTTILHMDNWYHGYLQNMLNASDTIRSECIPKQVYVCGM